MIETVFIYSLLILLSTFVFSNDFEDKYKLFFGIFILIIVILNIIGMMFK